MSPLPIPARRLASQLVSHPRLAAPAQVVSWLGAVQAQDFLASLWALGLRLPQGDEAGIEAALAEGCLLRTHIFRGTWQLVAREDVRWMLALVSERLIASAATRLAELELDAKTLARATELFAEAVAGGKQRTREELAEVLARRRISTEGQSLMHLLWYAELRGVLCSGGRRGKQPTYALLAERAPDARVLPREEALAELARRYFQSRGPATEHDFSWWTGLPLREVREAIALVESELQRVEVGDRRHWFIDDGAPKASERGVHLLPAFDEYLVGYQDRSDVLEAVHLRRVNSGGGMLKPALVVDGHVVGTWRRTLAKRAATLVVEPFRPLTQRERESVEKAAERYGRFLRLPVALDVLSP